MVKLFKYELCLQFLSLNSSLQTLLLDAASEESFSVIIEAAATGSRALLLHQCYLSEISHASGASLLPQVAVATGSQEDVNVLDIQNMDVDIDETTTTNLQGM